MHVPLRTQCGGGPGAGGWLCAQGPQERVSEEGRPGDAAEWLVVCGWHGSCRLVGKSPPCVNVQRQMQRKARKLGGDPYL